MRLKVSKSKNTTLFYIIKDYTKNGKRSTKIVKRIGNIDDVKIMADDMDYNIWLKEYVKKFNEEHGHNETILIKKNNNRLIEKDVNKLFNVGYLFLEKIYNDLNIKNICEEIQKKHQFHFDLNEILSYLVYARIIYPSSKLETFKQCKKFIKMPNFELHDEYRALSYLAKYLDFIQQEIFNNSKNLINRNSKVIYYDCTNYFFEIDDEDDLRKYGASKEHRPNPIVGMGLFMDGDGLPLSMNIYPGNRNEQKTLIPEETKIVKNFKLEDTKIILCTDAGLSSDKIKKYNIKDGRAFVITQSLKKLKSEIKEKVFDKSDWRIVGDLRNVYNIENIEKDSSLKEKYYDTIFYKIIEYETQSVKQDLIVTFCFKYLDYCRNIRNNQIERARKSIQDNQVTRKGKNQNDYRRFIESINSTDDGEVAENIEYSINQEKIDEEEKYDGFYAITTNLVGDIKEIIKIVKGRWEIEESFRIMKSDFLARPINLSREDRINAHFLTCFIALFIYRLLEKKLDYKYTTTQIIDTLKNMNLYEVKGDGYLPTYTRTDLTDELHERFDFRTDYEINTYSDLKKIFKQIKQ